MFHKLITCYLFTFSFVKILRICSNFKVLVWRHIRECHHQILSGLPQRGNGLQHYPVQPRWDVPVHLLQQRAPSVSPADSEPLPDHQRPTGLASMWTSTTWRCSRASDRWDRDGSSLWGVFNRLIWWLILHRPNHLNNWFTALSET